MAISAMVPLCLSISLMKTWVDAHPHLALGTILIIALFLGIVRLWTDPPDPIGYPPDVTWNIALNLASGRGFTACEEEYFPFCGAANQLTAMRGPIPVIIYAAFIKVAGNSILLASSLEIFLNLLIIIAIYLLSKEWAGPRAALLASTLWAGYLPAVKLISHISSDLVAALATSLALYFFLHARKTNHLRHWLAAGGFMGLGILSRSAVAILPLILATGWVIEQRLFSPSRWPQLSLHRLLPLMVFIGAVLLLNIPWLVRNQLAFGQPVIGSTLTGYNLYRHNQILATDDYLHYVSPAEAKRAIQSLISTQSGLRGNENEAEMDAFFQREALQIIRTHPLRYLALSAYRFLPLWFNWKVKEAYGTQTGTLDGLIIVQQIIILIGATQGVLAAGRRAWPLATCIVAFSVVYMLVNSLLRYLIPVMPLAVSLSAAGILHLTHRLKRPAHKFHGWQITIQRSSDRS